MRWLLLLLAACGGEDDDGTGDGADDGTDVPACSPGTVVIEGTVGGLPLDATIHQTSAVFVNALGDSPGYLEIGGEEGTMRLEFETLLATGDSGDARGTADLGALGTWGNCEGSLPSTITLGDDDSGTFVLREIHADADCANPAEEGELVGCWATSP